MTRNRKSFALEKLEERALLSANSVTLQNGLLNIVANPAEHHTALISQTANNAVQVQLDGHTFTFTDPVTRVNYTGGNRGDNVTDLVNVGGFFALGNGNNVINSKASGQTIVAGNGKNFIQDFAAGNTIVAGNGQNNIYGGPGDSIVAGSGRDIIYDILGTNTITIAGHAGRDYVFTSASSTVTGTTANDRVATLFAANRQAGSGTLVLANGVLYFTANNNGDSYVLNQVGNKLVATYNLGDGNGFQTQTFDRSAVNLIANFGGAGNDTLINNTSIPDVQYGAGGNNVVIGGFGALDLEKAGGASGNSLVVGRSSAYNDLTASLSAGATATLITNPNARQNVARSVNSSDVIFGLSSDNGVYIGPLNPNQIFSSANVFQQMMPGGSAKTAA
jgi:hypothetical protein